MIARSMPTRPRPWRRVLARCARAAAPIVAIAGCIACSTPGAGPLKAVPTGSHRLCVGEAASNAAPCRTAPEVEALLSDEALEVLRARPTPGGAQGASVLTLHAPPREGVFEAKWRPASSADEYNDPAAERLAYEAQKLVLDPRDYVVPPTVSRCLPEARPGSWLKSPSAGSFGTGCALGYLSYWLSGSTTLREARRDGLFPTPEDEMGVWSADPQLYDGERFDRDPVYRRAIANLNVVAFLIGHGDAHTGQFVMYLRPLHLFVVDNSVAFGVRPNAEMSGRQDLSALTVPAVPVETARRIDALREEDVRALASVDGWVRRDGWLHPTHIEGVLGDPTERTRDGGERVQMGLRSAEIDDLLARVRWLQEALGEGRLETFGDGGEGVQ